ncbi:MAG: hypothetical protein RMY34_20330 [Aulosira sp. DedQUE10]|nr:hypothetical protein [Aulosira sp. DedQUE10]
MHNISIAALTEVAQGKILINLLPTAYLLGLVDANYNQIHRQSVFSLVLWQNQILLLYWRIIWAVF